jgi:outer membrane receptor protein involved in Fe transport
VVTAQKREQNLQDVPISVSALAGERLRESGASALEDVTAYVPNFSMSPTGIANAIAVRGISSGVNQGFEQSVGMYVDDVYYGRGQLARVPLLDLERIEIARGPQPILFGKNSIAGAVGIATAKPTRTFEGSIAGLHEPDTGEDNVTLVLSGPLGDRLAGRVAVLERDLDGYYTNVYLDRKEEQRADSVLRATLAWDATDRIAVTAKIERGELESVGRNSEMVNSIALPGGIDYISALTRTVTLYNGAVTAGLAAPPPIPYLPDDGLLDYVKSTGTSEQATDFDNATLTIDYSVGDHVLTFVTGRVEYDFFQLCDCDFVSAPIVDGSSFTEGFSQTSQEIRFVSSPESRITYIVGLYLQTSDLSYADTINVPPDGVLRALNPALANIDTRRSFHQDEDMAAVFGQATWTLGDSARLTLGGRYTDETKSASRTQVHHAGGMPLPATDPAGVTPSFLWAANPLFGAFMIEPYAPVNRERDESRFTPSLTVEWQVSDSAMLYAKYVTGFKAGGFDVRSNAHPDSAVVNALNLRTTPPTDIVGVFEYEDEEARSYELGAKTTLGQGRAELNVALYDTDYDDLQTSVFDGALGFNVANASRASIRGMELDGRWAVGTRVELSASLGYLDFEFDDFRFAQCYFNDPRPVTGPGTCDATGARKENTPEWTAALIAAYAHPFASGLSFTARPELLYSASYVWSPTLDPVATQDAVTRLNLRLALAGGSWEVALLGRNLTDERVSTFGGNATLSALLTNGTGNAYYTFVERPRSWALQGTYRFGGR